MLHSVRAVSVGSVISAGLIRGSVSTPAVKNDISVSTPPAIKFFLAAALISAFAFTATFARAAEPPRPGCVEEDELADKGGIGALAAALIGYDVVVTEESYWAGGYTEHGRPRFETRNVYWYCPRLQPAAAPPPPPPAAAPPSPPTFTPAPYPPELGPLPPTFTPASYAPELTFSLGGAGSTTSWTNQRDISFFTIDPTLAARVFPFDSGFVGGVGIYVPPELVRLLLGPLYPFFAASSSPGPTASRYAPEDKPASGFPAALPTKAPPKAPPPPPRITFALDGNVYFFSGANSTINGIPGGPGITPTGNDSFNFKDRYLFTVGGVINVPINARLLLAVTGGFAEADKSMTYNCGTYCTTGGVTPFSASKDVWLPGGYVGGRMQTPLAIGPWPGTTISFDYKHVFLDSESVTLGAAATRQVTANVSQGIDMFMVRLAVPLHMLR